MKYFRAKWDHYIDRILQQFQMTNQDLHDREVEAKQWDPWIENRVEYMYTYNDHRHDRHRVRERFVKHANKKTTIQDIGVLLDKWILDSKAKIEHFQPHNHVLEQPDIPQKDITDVDLYWQNYYLHGHDPVKPSWLHDDSELKALGPA